MGRIERALGRAGHDQNKDRAAESDRILEKQLQHEQESVGEIGIDFSALPKIKLNPTELFEQHRVIMAAADPIASSAYKILRTRVLQRMRSNGWRTLAITGTCPNEGKTLTAINLAISMAGDVNTTTALIDLDLRRPSIYKYLNHNPRYSILDCLHGRSTLEEAMVNPGHERLGVLMNSQPIENSSETLASPKMSQLMTQLKTGSDRIVIFDMPPLSASDDVLAFGPLVDAVLIVTAEGVTQHHTLLHAREMSQDMNIIGTILNKSSDKISNYYYYS